MNESVLWILIIYSRVSKAIIRLSSVNTSKSLVSTLQSLLPHRWECRVDYRVKDCLQRLPECSCVYRYQAIGEIMDGNPAKHSSCEIKQPERWISTLSTEVRKFGTYSEMREKADTAVVFCWVTYGLKSMYSQHMQSELRSVTYDQLLITRKDL